MKHSLFTSTLIASAMGFAGMSIAEPAVVFDLGGKFDKSFNEAAYTGAERWASETGGTYANFEISSDAQREQAIRRFAETGKSPIVVAGFAWAAALDTVAPVYPDTDFVIIDMVVDQPNVRSVVFNEHEGSYLVGLMAGMASETDVVGFIGGMDIPLIRKFGCGYAEGVLAANADATVITNMVGTTPSAWNDPIKGSELTLAQISQNADVVFAAAGGTGVGVLQTATDQDILSIGVDSNQNYLHPGQVLTSMVKRVDNAVFSALKGDGLIAEGINVMGVANGGVGYTLDEFNDAIVSDDMRTALVEAEAAITSGALVVHDYMSNESCPFVQF
ncbi:BMP family ABC transporter substrate-binding protein [Ascidiaceihabitans sp.]|uniref:BMP family lipoprotein n=1 Tax=Ascidiaceihabitans sp. TaxID=1872644 RepID=UPI00329771C8